MKDIERYRDVSMTAARWLAETDSLEELFTRYCTLLSTTLGEAAGFLAFAHADRLRLEYCFEGGITRRLDGPEVPPSSAALEVLVSKKARVVRASERRLIDTTHQAHLYSAYVPLIISNRVEGIFWMTRVSPSAFSEGDVELLETIAGFLSAAVRSHQAALATSRLEQLAATDSLTGVPNRRAFDHRLQTECVSSVYLSLLMIDIDHFKIYNDSYGHLAGDNCLKQIAQRAVKCLGRSTDFLARYGGEEFVAVLPRTDLEGAIRVAENIRAAIYEMALPHAGNSDGVVTISVGVASAPPDESRRATDLVERADRALYDAKSSGRNRVCAENLIAGERSPRVRVASHLPVPTSRFFGREQEVADIRRLIDSYRTVTIVGTGGIGKTRLALQTALECADRFGEDIRFVDLASTASGDRVAERVAAELGVPVIPEAGPLEQLVETLEQRRLLLILDNCEHLISGCAELAERLSRNCAQVHLL
ncbi:MAG: diguanylate cyclase, partial [Candidatus Eremiobacteraeota bacterium]|nr:diguanylate cyclase [Candidatus Eremiobacteraeota bacterium]